MICLDYLCKLPVMLRVHFMAIIPGHRLTVVVENSTAKHDMIFASKLLAQHIGNILCLNAHVTIDEPYHASFMHIQKTITIGSCANIFLTKDKIDYRKFTGEILQFLLVGGMIIKHRDAIKILAPKDSSKPEARYSVGWRRELAYYLPR